MGRTSTDRVWPDVFPTLRTLIAFAVVPVFSNLALFALMAVWNLLHPLPGRNILEGDFLSPQHIYEVLLLALVYSVPGYLTFLVVFLPILYILYRFDYSGFVLFGAIGAVVAFAAWTALGFGPHPGSEPGMRFAYLWSEFMAVGLVGAIDGIVTRLIVLGGSTRKHNG